MHVDYTKYFKTSDELVDFLMLDNEQQNRILATLLAKDNGVGTEMSCAITERRADNTVKKAAAANEYPAR